MKILVQFPTLKRPQKFLSCLDRYVKGVKTNPTHFNINCDVIDDSMKDPIIQQAISDIVRQNNLCSYTINFDSDTTKITAINDHIHEVDFDVLVCASDDMNPQVDNWDEEICCAMQEHYPDLDGCVHFNDGHTNGNLITFSILGRELYNHFGYIYHPDYKSLYADDEFTQEVRRMDKETYIDKIIITHDHYGEEDNINSGDFDYAAEKTLHFSGRDGYVFAERLKRGFPKERITND